MQTAKVQSSLCFRAVSLEPVLLAHVSGRPRENFSQSTKGPGMRTEILVRREVRKTHISRDAPHFFLKRTHFNYFSVCVCSR